MDRLLKILGIGVLFYGIYVGVNYLVDHYKEILPSIFQWFGVASFVVLVLFVVVRLIYGKNWLITGSKNLYFGSGLVNATNKLIKEVKQRDIQDETVAEVGAHVVWRLTRIGIFALVFASIPLVLLWRQNTLIEGQNEKIESQNLLFFSTESKN